jgi:hypothetical protein
VKKQRRATRSAMLLCAHAAVVFSACAPPVGPSDASAQDAAIDSATHGDGAAAPDAAVSCVDVTGAWEWTGSCSDPRVSIEPTTCQTQTGCTVRGFLSGTGSLVGNVLTNRYRVAQHTVDAVETVTFDGDRATMAVTVTAPIRVTCTATGRRVTFEGATSYCCDVNRASCGAGERCVPVTVGTSNFAATACTPDGTTPLGGACMRQMDRLGTDTCAGNRVCANLGQPSVTQRVCAATCANASDCGANEICRQLGDTPQTGVCRPRCALFGSDCQPAATCRPVVAWGATSDRSIRWEPHCEFTGPRAEGMACRDSSECAADLVCATTAEGGICRRACDATHACPANFQCTAFNGGAAVVTNETGLGACDPM